MENTFVELCNNYDVRYDVDLQVIADVIVDIISDLALTFSIDESMEPCKIIWTFLAQGGLDVFISSNYKLLKEYLYRIKREDTNPTSLLKTLEMIARDLTRARHHSSSSGSFSRKSLLLFFFVFSTAILSQMPRIPSTTNVLPDPAFTFHGDEVDCLHTNRCTLTSYDDIDYGDRKYTSIVKAMPPILRRPMFDVLRFNRFQNLNQAIERVAVEMMEVQFSRKANREIDFRFLDQGEDMSTIRRRYLEYLLDHSYYGYLPEKYQNKDNLIDDDEDMPFEIRQYLVNDMLPENMYESDRQDIRNFGFVTRWIVYLSSVHLEVATILRKNPQYKFDVVTTWVNAMLEYFQGRPLSVPELMPLLTELFQR